MRDARIKFWKTVVLAVILIVIGVTDMGEEAIAFGIACLFAGGAIHETYLDIDAAMDAEERG